MHGGGGRSLTDRGVEENIMVVAGGRDRARLPTDQPAADDFPVSDRAAAVGRFRGRSAEMPPDDGATGEGTRSDTTDERHNAPVPRGGELKSKEPGVCRTAVDLRSP